MPVQLLRIREAALHRLLAALVQTFPRLRQTVGVDRFLVVLPHMTNDDLDPVGALRALPLHRATGTLAWCRGIFPVALAVGRTVSETLAIGTDIGILLPVVDIVAFVEIARAMVRTAVADDAVDIPLYESLADGRGEIAGIQPDRADVKAEALPHAVEPVEVRHAVMNVGGGDVDVGNQRMLAVDGAVVEVEEAGGLAVPDHVAGVHVGAAELDVPGRRLPTCWRQGRLAVVGTVGFDRGLQFGEIGCRGLLNPVDVVPVLVGAGFEVGAIAVEDAAADEAVFDGSLDDAVEDGLFDVAAGKAAPAVLREGGGVDDAVGERQAEEPAVGDVDLDLTHQLALGTDAEEVADEEHLEQLYGIDGGTAVVGAVQMPGGVADEVEGDVAVDQTKQVIRRNQLFEGDHFQPVLVRGRRFEHDHDSNTKPPACGGFVSSLAFTVKDGKSLNSERECLNPASIFTVSSTVNFFR